MADLLECLIQIKALRETLHRLTGLPTTATRAGSWEQLAETERRYAGALGTAIAGVADTAPSDDGPGANRDRFVTWRRANLAMLDRCTAAELAGFVGWPGRPSTTVADLVAIMLASDTEELGELRRDGARRLPWRETVEESEVEGSLREPGRVASKGAGPG